MSQMAVTIPYSLGINWFTPTMRLGHRHLRFTAKDTEAQAGEELAQGQSAGKCQSRGLFPEDRGWRPCVDVAVILTPSCGHCPSESSRCSRTTPSRGGGEAVTRVPQEESVSTAGLSLPAPRNVRQSAQLQPAHEVSLTSSGYLRRQVRGKPDFLPLHKVKSRFSSWRSPQLSIKDTCFASRDGGSSGLPGPKRRLFHFPFG